MPSVDTSGSDVSTSSLFPGDSCRWTQLSGRAYMLGTVAACASCPCRYRADFTSGLATCDTVVPTIMSPDKQTIYSRGNPYEILPSR